jgi:hypothetical protein
VILYQSTAAVIAVIQVLLSSYYCYCELLIVSQIVPKLSLILIITINKLDNNNLVAKYPTDTFATSALLVI